MLLCVTLFSPNKLSKNSENPGSQRVIIETLDTILFFNILFENLICSNNKNFKILQNEQIV